MLYKNLMARHVRSLSIISTRDLMRYPLYLEDRTRIEEEWP